METNGLPTNELVNELINLAVDLTPVLTDKPAAIRVLRFDRDGTEIGEQVISRAKLARLFQDSMVIGAKNGMFKVLV